MAKSRLGQLTTQLNIGINTAIDFLKKKNDPIELPDSEDKYPSIKLSESQENLLMVEFSSDKTLKEHSEMLTKERQQKDTSTVDLETKKAEKRRKERERREKKAQEAEEKAIQAAKEAEEKALQVKLAKEAEEIQEIVEEQIAIDEAPSNTEVENSNVEIEKAPIKADIVEVSAAVAEVKEEVVEKVSPEEPKAEVDKPEPEKSESKPEPKVEEKKEPAKLEKQQKEESEPQIVEEPVKHSKPETEVFKMKVPTLDGPKVLDKIDLSKIDSNTRPKKETRKERQRRIEEEKRQRAESQKKQQKKQQKNEKQAKPQEASKSKSGGKKTDFIETRIPTLQGPKVLDKIDLDEDKQKPSDGRQDDSRGKKRGQQAEGKSNDRRRRDRIKTERVDISDDGQGRGKFSKKDRRSKGAPIVDKEDVAQNIKETLAIARKGRKFNKKAADYRKEKRENIRQEMERQAELEEAQSKVLQLTEFVTANELAAMMKVPVNEVIKVYMSLGMFVSINQRLDADTINLVADEFGFQTEFVSAEVLQAIDEEEDDEKDLIKRPPIVTVMGHVDHGKTSLLDYIRKTNVIAGEAGGITQHIGAYNVQLENGEQITFIDTPGHEAFTAMRARGAKVTDIAIIVIAADDCVMPQTVEAINHAASAGVPMVFAINKIDKDGADPEKIKSELANMNYLVESWGGKYQSQEISAKKGIGMKELLDKVLLESEMLELKANPKRRASGSVIDVRKDKGRGNEVTLLVQNGTLEHGDIVVAGHAFGRIRAMFNERNQQIKKAKPSDPVLILGMRGELQAGDNFNVMPTEQEAREIVAERDQLKREQSLRTTSHITLDEIGRRIALGNFQELNLIVKGDVDGSIEALSDSLIKLSTPEIQVNVIHKGIGQITEGDVNLAISANAIIIGFQVRPTTSAKQLADTESVDIRTYSIIYQAIEEVKAAMEGMLIPEKAEKVTATLEVRETFHISKVGTIAGCMVREGTIKRSNKVRLIHDGIVVHTGDIASLKHLKDDAKEIRQGYECGLGLANYNDISVGDIIEAFEIVEVKKTLD